MHAPGEEIDRIGPSSYRRFLFEDAVEPTQFRAQHQALIDILRGEGVDVALAADLLRGSPLIARIRQSPNLVYTRDTVAVTRDGSITMRMKSPVRRHEPAIAAAALERLGVRELATIRSPATMEGGDLIFLDAETLLVGVGNRTTAGALRQLRAAAAESLRSVVAISLPKWAIHLDGTMMVIDRDLALVHRESMMGPAVVYQEGKAPRRTRALTFLRSRGMRILEVTAYERQRRATNVITLGPRKLVGYAGHARVRKMMNDEGVDLIEVEGSELVRGGGGPRCMTAPIERDNGRTEEDR
jgi:arginine deiminase